MTPELDVLAPTGPVRAVVLVLHGGRANSVDPTSRFKLSYLRMLPFAAAVHRATRDKNVAVWRLRYRVRGWNGTERDPVRDVKWALAEVKRRHGAAPVVLIGHSMGGRAALYCAGDPSVTAVCALAPWIEPGDPLAQLADVTLVIAHGDRERMTSPAASYRYAVAAKRVTDRVARFVVHGDGHAMLRRWSDWTALVVRFTLGALGVTTMPADVAAALARPEPEGLNVPLPESASTPVAQ